MCRSAFDITIGLCCDIESDYSVNCNTEPDNVHSVQYEICTSDLANEEAFPLICPLPHKACSICDDEDDPACHSEPEYMLDPVEMNSTTISLSNMFFRDGEACYFKLHAN